MNFGKLTGLQTMAELGNQNILTGHAKTDYIENGRGRDNEKNL